MEEWKRLVGAINSNNQIVYLSSNTADRDDTFRDRWLITGAVSESISKFIEGLA